ncbi:MAG: DNA topoisomerase I, partial [Candidatus Heimdallarchaeota archaeon]
MAKINKLTHNGIMLSDIKHLKLTIGVKDTRIELDPMQEQMAIAWVRKLSTVYVDDPVFCKNFFADFSIKLGHENLTDEDIDFSEVIEYIESERAKRESLTKEQKKQKREERKVVRVKLKEYYGTAYLDGMKVDVGAWTAEPSSIFMGRGEHPMRGKWKEGPSSKDIILNLSELPETINKEDWKEIVWEPECLWVAKWEDKLSKKTKYVWLSDNTPLKQDREIEKFNKAKKISNHLEKIRFEVDNGIKSDNPRTRKIALACYIIDHLILRVGDEKDEDEADTVGATTLRPEHVTIDGENINFNFLGKDSVEWNKDTTFPPHVVKELQFLIDEAEKSGEDKPQIFSKIGSTQVNDFFSKIVPDLTAKVFRTFHATNIVSAHLEESDTIADDPEYKKKEAATMANREAAVVCTHMKQVPKNWDNRIQRFRERKIKSTERIEKAKLNQGVREERLEDLKKNLRVRRYQEKTQQKILEQIKADSQELEVLSNTEQDTKE